MKKLLGVNVDHVASVRQLRKGALPDPVEAALVCAKAGADSIVAHLREDRRHIREQDMTALKKRLCVPLNMEMSIADDIVAFACKLKPFQATLVPERRQELTTEGGLDVLGNTKKIRRAAERLKRRGIKVSLFIDPDTEQINAALKTGADRIELHTGEYANAVTAAERKRRLTELTAAAWYGKVQGLRVFAGHGLDYQNTQAVAAIPQVEEFNIGYSIISRALYTGLASAVKEMKRLIR
ncbi:MAG: pyridoxine 5'-phosphate synthase [Deltaproteobacteria bacterium]